MSSYVLQVVGKMVVTGSSDCTACAFLLNSYQPPAHFTAHKKTIICMKAVDDMRAYYLFCPVQCHSAPRWKDVGPTVIVLLRTCVEGGGGNKARPPRLEKTQRDLGFR